METEKEFLTDVYTQLSEIEATLDIMSMSRRAIDDVKIMSEMESLYIVSSRLKRNVCELADKIDKRIYTRL